MIELPGHVLKKLRCVQCGGYLSYGPLVINEKNEQFCGRCFDVLPDQIKSRCLRQTGLEAVAEVLIFPCRYRAQGCTYTFPWNCGARHESSCPHRDNSLEEPNSSALENRNKAISVNVFFVNKYQNEDLIKLNIEVVGENGNKLYLNDDNIKLNVELTLGLNTPPPVRHSHVNVEKLFDEHLYEIVPTVSEDVKCSNCRKSILTTDIFHCGFGHPMCKSCKRDPCHLCGNLSQCNPQHYCKNYHRGCRDLFPSSHINKHETDCEYNDFYCRLCKFSGFLNHLVEHFIHGHDCILSSVHEMTISKQDKELYFYCFSKLFCCRYYYFDDKIEFLVSYIGSNDRAAKHKYEINLSSESIEITKRAKCLGWNEVLLNEGIIFIVKSELLKTIKVRITIL